MLAEVFTEINKAEPCKLIDLPQVCVCLCVGACVLVCVSARHARSRLMRHGSGQSKVPLPTKKIIDGAAEKLRRRYS